MMIKPHLMQHHADIVPDIDEVKFTMISEIIGLYNYIASYKNYEGT